MATETQDCPQCRRANPAGMKFCGFCGSSLSLACARCGFGNPGGFRFCGACAAPLTAGAAAAAPAGPPPATLPAGVRDAERRQLTVLFIDLVGSVRLSEALDAEDLRDLVRAYQGVVARAIEDAKGHIAQYLGDGILAYFGYPVAHEDDAVQAIRAALRCVAGMAQLSQARGQPIELRVGIHTGIGVIGEMGAGLRHERLAIGNAPNIAARIQAMAEPHQVLVSAATRALTAEHFEFSAPQSVVLKGVSQALEVSRVLAEQATQHRIAQHKKLGLRPLLGRGSQLGELEARFAQARARRGSTVLITGEAGIGKSRLVFAFASALPPDTLALSARCSPQAQNSPLLPLVELFGQMFEITSEQADRPDEARLRQHLAASTDPEAFGLIADFLSIKTDASAAGAGLSAAKRRDRTLQVLREVLLAEAALRPVVVFVEDLHWLDPSTLDFIESLMEPGAQTGLMLVLTARPAFVSPWGYRPYLQRIDLQRLGPGDAEALMRTIAGDKPLPLLIVKDLLARADGVPLYVEEMTKAVIESGMLREGAAGYELNLPASLRDSLAARLDHLGPAKGVAQLAAVIGRHFAYAVLAAIAPMDARELRRHIDQLVRAELVQFDDAPGPESYGFRHALIRDAAYDSLLRKEREDLHGRVAQALQATSAQACADRPEILALHLEGAGQLDAAVAGWAQAGQVAMGRSAHRESIAHFTHAIGLLGRQPASPARDQTELGLQLALGGNYIATEGWSSGGVMRAFGRARDLCQGMGLERPVFPALWGVWSYHFVAGNFRDALEVSEQLRAIAEPTGDPGLLLPMIHACGYASMFASDYRAALDLTNRGLALYDIDRERELVAMYQQSSSGVCCNISSICLWVLGYPDQARERAALDAQIHAHLGNRACDAWHLASLLWGVATLVRDTAWVRQCEAQGLALSAEIENIFWPPLLRCVGGWARVMDGDAHALDDLQRGLDAWRGGGAGVLTTIFYGLYLEACLAAGQVQRGLDFVPTALAYVAQSGEHHFETELHRLHGELLVAGPAGPGSAARQAAALAQVGQALVLAKASGARSFALRAAMSQLRICRGQPSEPEALAMLAEIYDGFTEGLQTPDLIAARGLLGRAVA